MSKSTELKRQKSSGIRILLISVTIGVVLGFASSELMKDYKQVSAELNLASPARIEQTIGRRSFSEKYFNSANLQLKNEVFWRKFLQSDIAKVASIPMPSNQELTEWLRSLRIQVVKDFYEARESTKPDLLAALQTGIDFATFKIEMQSSTKGPDHKVLKSFLDFAVIEIPIELKLLTLQEVRNEIRLLDVELEHLYTALKTKSAFRADFLRTALKKAESLGIDSPRICESSNASLPTNNCYLEAVRLMQILGSDNLVYLGGTKYLQSEIAATEALQAHVFLDDNKTIRMLQNRKQSLANIEAKLTNPQGADYITVVASITNINESEVSRLQVRAFLLVLGMLSGILVGTAYWIFLKVS